MPTYQYACTECGEQLEAVQKFTDDALTECPACSGVLRKVFSSVGVVFKGSGFYRTDSRSGSSSGVAAGSGASASSGSSDSSGGSAGSGGSGNGSDSSGGGSSAPSSAPAASTTPKPAAPTAS